MFEDAEQLIGVGDVWVYKVRKWDSGSHLDREIECYIKGCLYVMHFAYWTQWTIYVLFFIFCVFFLFFRQKLVYECKEMFIY